MNYEPTILYNGYIDKYFSRENFPGDRPKQTIEARHSPLSVSIATKVSDFKGGMCFVTNGDENELVQNMLDCLEHALSGTYELVKKICSCFSSIGNQKKVVKKRYRELEACCREIIVVGFNCASYDF